MAAIPYIALNPVRARLVSRAEDWRWSSVHAHLDPATGDGLTDITPVRDRVADFSALLRAGEDEPLSMALRRAETVGRPLGDDAFMAWIQAAVGRDAKPGKRGPAGKDS